MMLKKDNSNMMAGAGSSSSSSTSAPPPPWIELPKDLTLNILGRLAKVEILESVEFVCTTWKNICWEPSLWRVIDLINHPYKSYGMLCHSAVDRSQGELIDITIRDFVTDELLHYISDRSRHLKRLTLGSCNYVSPGGLTTAIKNFPHLEELHLNVDSVFDIDVKAIGISCPWLKSFSFNQHYLGFPPVKETNRTVLSIAKNMPSLYHLSLIGNNLSNEGLQAILDCCPNLESLDLRRCSNVDLESDLGRKCSERIKELKCSPKSTHYYEWDDYDDIVYVDEEDDWYNDWNNDGF